MTVKLWPKVTIIDGIILTRRNLTTHCSGARNSEPLMLDMRVLAVRTRPLNSVVGLLLVLIVEYERTN
jgi:hypothetical protein